MAENGNGMIKAKEIGEKYALYCGDSAEVLQMIPGESVHYIIYSPPFQSLYVYSNSDRDLGNCRTPAEFYEQFRFIGQELYRTLMPGRLMSFHCMNLPTSKERDGYIGIRDFRGELIRFFEDLGFIYHSEVCIWKDPVTSMQRTKALGLLHKQLKKDSCMSRQGIPDYLVTMRKPGDNPERVTHTNETFPVSLWQRYASPVWMDINPNDTLQYRSAREDEDERHICFAEGTLVLTKRGYVPIETVVPGADEVLANDGAWHFVTGKAKTAENANVVQAIAHGVPLLISTPEHKIMAKRGYGRHQKENLPRVDPDWVEAKDLAGCYVKAINPPQMESSISAQEWWLIGRWLADGHVDARDHQYMVSIGNEKWDIFADHAKDHIGHIAEKGTCKQVGLINLSSDARELLSKCGRGASGKMLPVECISLNKELSSALFDGYISGDGHYMADGKIAASSVSRALLLGIAIVAQKVTGKVAAVYAGRPERESVIEGRKVHCKAEWNLIISPNYTFSSLQNGTAWKKVKKVVPHGTADVWSLEVDQDHSYTAEGCVVKNCPLQLPVIERGIELWTNPGDIVLTPFMGIGSEAYTAVKMGRRAVGVELKDSYYRQAVANVKSLTEKTQADVFDLMEENE